MRSAPVRWPALVAILMLSLGCDAYEASWIKVSTSQKEDTLKMWSIVTQEAKKLGMSCGEGPVANPGMYSALHEPIHSELFCDWINKKRKMYLFAAYSERDLLVYAPWATTEFWYSETEGHLIVQELSVRLRQVAPTAEITLCFDDCKLPEAPTIADQK